MRTMTTMAAGLILAAIVNIPVYNWVFMKDWGWADHFFLILFANGLSYMDTFFHELGHTAFAWFFGYATVPVFDFNHGGGLAVMLSGQQIPILVCVYGALGYGIYVFHQHKIVAAILAAALILNLSLAFSDHHESLIDFMGPAIVPPVAAFFLYRALMDLAPRGAFERFLNAFFGFGMILHNLIDSSGLLQNNVHRMLYYQQKGQHGFGDFDKIAMRTGFLDFDGVVWIFILWTILFLILPFIVFFRQKSLENNYM